MATPGPGFEYALFAVAVFLVAAPLTLLSVLLEPWTSTYPRALASSISGLTGFAFAAVLILQIDPATATTPLLMALGYAFVPVCIATIVLLAASRLRYPDALKYATGSWLATHVLVFLPGIATNPLLDGTTPPIFTLIDTTSPVLGVQWYTGFLGLTAGVGVIAGVLGYRIAGR